MKFKHLNPLLMALCFCAGPVIATGDKAYADLATILADARTQDLPPGQNSGDNNVKAQEFVDRGKRGYRSQDYQAAISNYSEALKLKPGDARLFFNRGLAYLKAEDLEHALADFSDCLAIAPGVYMALMNRANINVRKGRLVEALLDYDKAIELKADDFLIWYNRGVVYSRLGDTENALRDLNQALKLNPYDGPSYSVRADLYFAQGEKELAAADYRRVLVITPDTKHATERLAEISSVLGPSVGTGGEDVAPDIINLAVNGCFAQGDAQEGLQNMAVTSGWRPVASEELKKQSSAANSVTGGWTFESATGPVAVIQSRENISPPVRICSITTELPSAVSADDLQTELQSAFKAEPANKSENGELMKSGYWVPHTTECTARVSLVFSRTERTLTIRILHGRGGVAAAGHPNYPGNDGW